MTKLHDLDVRYINWMHKNLAKYIMCATLILFTYFVFAIGMYAFTPSWGYAIWYMPLAVWQFYIFLKYYSYYSVYKFSLTSETIYWGDQSIKRVFK
jgi:hypothetical protein